MGSGRCYDRVEYVERAIGNLVAANHAHQRALTVYEALLKANPDNAHLLVSKTLRVLRLGALDAERRREYILRAINILKGLEAAGRLEPRHKLLIARLGQLLRGRG